MVLFNSRLPEIDLEPKWVTIDGVDGIAVEDLQKLSVLFHAIEETKSDIAKTAAAVEKKETVAGSTLAKFKRLFWKCVFAKQLWSKEKNIQSKRKFYSRKKRKGQGSGRESNGAGTSKEKKHDLQPKFYCLTCKKYHAVLF